MNKLVGSQGLEYSNLDLLKLNDKQKYKVMLESINEKKATDEQIMYMTYHDRLTKLPNNIYFEYELEKAIKESIISHNEGAVIFIDVDNFNEINNSFGHNYGDILLIIISELMKSCVGDFGMVARMSGDEFLILLPKINSRSNLKNICDLIIKNFEN
ncbi:MAG: diguanylate cyclase domain-containing protein, partial [Clostridiaceae bacterium]